MAPIGGISPISVASASRTSPPVSMQTANSSATFQMMGVKMMQDRNVKDGLFMSNEQGKLNLLA